MSHRISFACGEEANQARIYGRKSYAKASCIHGYVTEHFLNLDSSELN